MLIRIPYIGQTCINHLAAKEWFQGCSYCPCPMIHNDVYISWFKRIHNKHSLSFQLRHPLKFHCPRNLTVLMEVILPLRSRSRVFLLLMSHGSRSVCIISYFTWIYSRTRLFWSHCIGTFAFWLLHWRTVIMWWNTIEKVSLGPKNLDCYLECPLYLKTLYRGPTVFILFAPLKLCS